MSCTTAIIVIVVVTAINIIIINTINFVFEVNITQRHVHNQQSESQVSFNHILLGAYLIFVIFFTRAKFLENKIYTEIYTVNRQFTQ